MTVVGSNYIFIHVPKSAGQSVTSRLGGMTKSLAGHTPLFHISPEQRAGKFAFGFVRNPWDRMVSLYSFMCTKKIKKHESAAYQQAISDMGFERWLMEDAFFMHEDREWRTPDLQPMQRRSQMFWLEGCDFIGKVESLEADFDRILERIHVKPSWRERLGFGRDIPHRNRSSRGSYRDYYTDASVAFVAEHFAPEIERFDYRY